MQLEEDRIDSTLNSLMFARDLFGDFCDHIRLEKIDTCKHNPGYYVDNYLDLR